MRIIASHPMPCGTWLYASAPAGDLPKLQRMAVQVQRASLRDPRSRDVIGGDAFHAVEAEIDLLELTAETRVPPKPEGLGPRPRLFSRGYFPA